MIKVQFEFHGRDDLSVDVQMPESKWAEVRERAVQVVNDQLVKRQTIEPHWPYRLVIEPTYVALESTYGLDPVIDDPSNDESWFGLVYVSTEFPQNESQLVDVDDLIERFMSAGSTAR